MTDKTLPKITNPSTRYVFNLRKAYLSDFEEQKFKLVQQQNTQTLKWKDRLDYLGSPKIHHSRLQPFISKLRNILNCDNETEINEQCREEILKIKKYQNWESDYSGNSLIKNLKQLE